MLDPIQRQSVSDAVFDQLRNRIVQGDLEPGAPLPAERVLCERLGVNRGAVREALRRLEQARLVSVRHGGTSLVLDYRKSAGMDLLVDLILTPGGNVDAHVVRSIVEMRSAIGPDVARLAAWRRTSAQADAADAQARALRAADSDLPARQLASMGFWAVLLEASQNLAYQLAFNTLRDVSLRSAELLRPLLEDELRDDDAYRTIARAVRAGDGDRAEATARGLLERGEQRFAALLHELEQAGEES